MKPGMDNRQINWIIGLAAVLGVVGTLATIPVGRLWFSLSVLFGAILGVGNLYLIRQMVRRSINAAIGGGQSAGQFMIKFGVLAAFIGLSFKFLPIEPLGFMLGFGVLVFAAVLGPLIGPDPYADAEAQDGDDAVGAE